MLLKGRKQDTFYPTVALDAGETNLIFVDPLDKWKTGLSEIGALYDLNITLEILFCCELSGIL